MLSKESRLLTILSFISIFSRILSNINNRYLIDHYPTSQEHDSKRRKIATKVKGHPKYSLGA
jgi:hypothetical protein